MRHYCPCCGYDGLGEPAYAGLGPPPWPDLGGPPYAGRLGCPSYEVCSCCGFDDEPGAAAKPSSFEEYRAEWLASGAEWFSHHARPEGWDLRKQLVRIRNLLTVAFGVFGTQHVG